MSHELQVRYSNLVDKAMRQNLVTTTGGPVPFLNSRYEGSPKAGSVKVPYRSETVVGDYSKTSGIALNASATAYKTILIQEDHAVNELIDGYDSQAVSDDMVADRLASAAYSLALDLDTDFVETLVDMGTESSDTAVSTSATAYLKAVAARTYLSKKKVPVTGRWMLASPDYTALLISDTTHVLLGSALGDAVVAEGFVAKVAGFYVKECAFLPANCEFICGHADWCVRVEEWAVDVRLQDLAGSGTFIGASAVQGRKVFDHYVTNEDAVYVKNITLLEGISVSPATDTIDLSDGETTQLTVTFDPVDSGNKNVTWTTSDATKATVSTGGVVTPVAAGTGITITATSEDGGFTDTCVITVTA